MLNLVHDQRNARMRPLLASKVTSLVTPGTGDNMDLAGIQTLPGQLAAVPCTRGSSWFPGDVFTPLRHSFRKPVYLGPGASPTSYREPPASLQSWLSASPLRCLFPTVAARLPVSPKDPRLLVFTPLYERACDFLHRSRVTGGGMRDEVMKGCTASILFLTGLDEPHCDGRSPWQGTEGPFQPAACKEPNPDNNQSDSRSGLSPDEP